MASIKYPVLLVDDDKEYANNFYQQAIDYEIKIFHKSSYNEMVESLPKFIGKIAAIILDIKCLIDSEHGAPDDAFLSKAIRFLDQNYSQIPRYILTGDTDGYEHVKRYSPHEKLFLKAKDEINLLQEIHKLDLDLVKVRSKYSDVFTLIDNSILPDETEVQLIKVLQKQESNDYTDILDSLSTIRRIQESILQEINKKRTDILPDDKFKENKDVKFWDAHNHLKGNPTRENNYKPTSDVYYSGVIQASSEFVYNLASDNGAHKPYDNPDYEPTKHTVISCTNAILDLIKWYGNLIV
jgi:hypothetical protein